MNVGWKSSHLDQPAHLAGPTHLFIWEKLSRLGEKIISTRSHYNPNFHQLKSSVQISWKFSQLREISSSAHRYLGQDAGNSFLYYNNYSYYPIY